MEDFLEKIKTIEPLILAKNITLENLEDEDERMEGNESEYFP